MLWVHTPLKKEKAVLGIYLCLAFVMYMYVHMCVYILAMQHSVLTVWLSGLVGPSFSGLEGFLCG